MDIKDIAERVGVPLDKAQELVAEIQRHSDPVCFQERQQTKDGYTDWYDAYVGRDIASSGSKICGGIEYQWRPLFTFPPDKAQIEQRVAEAIATQFGQQPHMEHFGDSIALSIRSGEWKKFRKGE